MSLTQRQMSSHKVKDRTKTKPAQATRPLLSNAVRWRLPPPTLAPGEVRCRKPCLCVGSSDLAPSLLAGTRSAMMRATGLRLAAPLRRGAACTSNAKRPSIAVRPYVDMYVANLLLPSGGELEHRVGPVAVLLARVQSHACPTIRHMLDHLLSNRAGVRVRVRVRVRVLVRVRVRV